MRVRACVRACAFAQIINEMAKQEIWIRLQDDLNRAYSVLRSLIDNEGRVCGLDMDLCRLLFKRISEIKDNKSLQIEFDDLPDNEKCGRAKKMLDCLMQYHLYGGRVEEYDSDKELAKMRQYAHKVNSLDTEMQKWEKDFSRLIYDIEIFVAGYCKDDSGTNDKNIQKCWSQDLINLFNGHSDLIDDVAMLDSDDDKLDMICRMSKQRYSAEDRTMKCKLPFDRLQTAWARALIDNKIISAKSAESLSKRFNKFK